jgi:hypothetical protein
VVGLTIARMRLAIMGFVRAFVVLAGLADGVGGLGGLYRLDCGALI